jgi:formate dehydrogenase assembly factor FdhD
MARECGMALAGFVREGDCVVYAHAQRFFTPSDTIAF